MAERFSARDHAHRFEALACEVLVSGLKAAIRSRFQAFYVAVVLGVVLLGSTLLLSSSPGSDQRITIYSPTANYSLNVVQEGGKDYVGLLEILEPLGRVAARQDGQKWKLRFRNVDSQFTAGATRARIARLDVDLTAPFLLQNNRGFIALDSLVTLLPQFLGTPVTFHSTARRLFIQQNGTTYSTELTNTVPVKLVLNFSNPVNPTIHTESGKLSMLFLRDPVIASGQPTVHFNDKTISSATFQESNGAAEITISTTAPLMASFSNNGRTITVAPAPSSAATVQQTPPVPGATVQQPTTPLPSASSASPARPGFVVAIDASHGGDERGAALADNLLEKDVTLALARRIRTALDAHGVSTLMLRDGDNTITADQRASAANAAHVSLYLGLHAANDGTGLRIYTALLPSTGESRGPFLSWDTAQASSLSRSQNTATLISSILGKTITTRSLTAPLRPLDSVTSLAVSIEVAPRTAGTVADLRSPDYQEAIADSVATAIASARASLEGAQ